MPADRRLDWKIQVLASPTSVLDPLMRPMREPRPGSCLDEISHPLPTRSQPVSVRRDASQASIAAGRVAAHTLPPIGLAANSRPLCTVSDSYNSQSIRRPSPRSRILDAADPMAAQSCPQVSTSIASRRPAAEPRETLKSQANHLALMADVAAHQPPNRLAQFPGDFVRMQPLNTSFNQTDLASTRVHTPRGTLSAAMKATARLRAACRLSKFRLTVDLTVYPKFAFSGSLQQFAASVAENFNQNVRKKVMSIDRKLYPAGFEGQSKSWSLSGSSIHSVAASRGPKHLILLSPEFEIEPNCSWREEVEAIWKYLDSKFVLLQTIGFCTTISLFLRPNIKPLELKRLAQAILHFEPSFEALMDAPPKRSSWARNNWLDNNLLGKSNVTRSEAIALLEMADVRDGPHSILSLIQGPEAEDYRWDLSPLLTSDIIRFRGTPGVTTFQDITGWVQATTSFVQAAMVFDKGSEILQQIPPTVQGFMCFVACGISKGIHRPEQWPRLRDGRNWNEIVTPIPSPLDRSVSPEVRHIQTALREADRLELEDLNKFAVLPYF